MAKKTRTVQDGYRGIFEDDQTRVVATGKQTKAQKDAVKRLNKFLSGTTKKKTGKK